LGGDATKVLMAGLIPVDIKEGINNVSIPIKHLCRKVNISIVPSSGIMVTGYQLCSAALGSYIIDSHSSAVTAVTAPVNSKGNSYGDFDAVRIEAPSAGVTVNTPIYYVYENLAGSNSNCTTEQARSEANAPANAMYLLVYAKTSSWYSIYYIYLGGMTNTSTPETDFSNFNVYRNMNYTYKINITGPGQNDARVIYTAEPLIGQFLFSDGTWGAIADNPGKTPIAVIFSTTTSPTDYNNGYTHGYAMALKNVNHCAWGRDINTVYTSTATTDITTVLTDYDGYTYTNQESLCAGAIAAKMYSGATAPSGTSGWYLPSIGQWFQICVNLGGMNSSGYEDASPYGIKWSNSASVCATAINNALSGVGSGNYDAFVIGSKSYWTSSEYNAGDAYYVWFGWDSDYNFLNLSMNVKTAEGSLRPVIAF